MSDNDQNDGDGDGVDWAAGKVIYPYPPAEPSAADVAISGIRNRGDLRAFVMDARLTAFLRPSELLALLGVAALLGVDVKVPEVPEDSEVRWFSGRTNGWRGIVHNALAAIRSQVQCDTKDDTPKKPPKKRSMNTAAADCARLYQADKGKTHMKTIIEDYVEQYGGRFATIMRILNDNPEQWKATPEATPEATPKATR